MELMTDEKKGFKKSDLGYVPEEWDVKKFGDLILDMKGGASLSKRNYTDHGIKVIPKGGVGRGGILNINSEDQNYCSLDYYKKHLNNAVDNEYTIIVLRDLVPSGPNIGLMVNIESDETYILAQGVYGFRVDSKETVADYLVHLSNSKQYRKLMQSILVGSTQVHVRNTTLKKIEIPLPPTLKEQQAIASALSDVDELIRSLDRLIQKKEAIKKGTMQQLLTGKKRLPGFDGEWEVKKLGDMADIGTGKKNNQDKIPNGKYPFFVRSQTVEKINSYSFDGEAILVPGEGGIGSIFHYIDGKFDYHQRVYKISHFSDNVEGKFVYYKMLFGFYDHAMEHSVKATVDSLRLPTFEKFEIEMPSSRLEQEGITEILDDMDRELQTLCQKREKYTQVKQGMMQELLTGKTRLV